MICNNNNNNKKKVKNKKKNIILYPVIIYLVHTRNFLKIITSYFLGGEKCYFFGRFCISTIWMISQISQHPLVFLFNKDIKNNINKELRN